MAQRKKAKKKEEAECPLCLLKGWVRDIVDRESPFFEHMNNAGVEFLEAVKVLIDGRIEAMKKESGPKKSKLTKIKVED